MFRTAPAVTALVVILLSGALHGTLSARWQPHADLSALAARLADVPEVIGDWQGETIESDAVTIRVADCAGMLQRRYVNAQTGQQVFLMLLVGRPGPLSVHLPEYCYQGLGYRMQQS